jgi:hypothetical protein
MVRDSDAKQYVEERMYKGLDWLKAFVDEWIKARDEELAARVRS